MRRKNAETLSEIVKENGHGFRTSFDIEANSPTRISSTFFKNFEDELRFSAEQVGVTYEEYVKIINRVIETGEVYNSGSFAMYFDYQNGRIYETGVRNK
ncbi:hypothetical protein OL548_19945 [Lysinibacillus sp. MHQ-1]|nr:hypothetical protein OL548_19945 [Lysinibacillus sp. MHQ-1]